MGKGNDSGETEEIKTCPLPLPATNTAGLYNHRFLSIVYSLFCLFVLSFMAQSTQWCHVEHCQFALPLLLGRVSPLNG